MGISKVKKVTWGQLIALQRWYKQRIVSLDLFWLTVIHVTLKIHQQPSYPSFSINITTERRRKQLWLAMIFWHWANASWCSYALASVLLTFANLRYDYIIWRVREDKDNWDSLPATSFNRLQILATSISNHNSKGESWPSFCRDLGRANWQAKQAQNLPVSASQI